MKIPQYEPLEKHQDTRVLASDTHLLGKSRVRGLPAINLILIHGKRKVGKTYCTPLFKQELDKLLPEDEVVVLCALQDGCKYGYAHYTKQVAEGKRQPEYGEDMSEGKVTDYPCDAQKLMRDHMYKEIYRKRMIGWYHATIKQNPNYFHQLAIRKLNPKTLNIISDWRYPEDLHYFEKLDQYKGRILKVKIVASEETRAKRGYKYEFGIGNDSIETALDSYGFLMDLTFCNQINGELNARNWVKQVLWPKIKSQALVSDNKESKE